jgi:hypothetical protein
MSSRIARRVAAVATTCLVVGIAGAPSPASAQLPIPIPTLPPLPIPTIIPLPTTIPGTTIPTDPAALAALLQSVATNPTQLLAIVQSVDPNALTAAVAMLAPAAVQQLTNTLGITSPTPTATTTAGPGVTVTPGPTASATATSAPVNTAVRAKVKKVKVAKNRRTVTVTLKCPIAACAVGLTGKVGSKRAFAPAYVPLTSRAAVRSRFKISAKARKVLLKKGGKLKISAATAGSTLAPATKTVKIAKPKKKNAA